MDPNSQLQDPMDASEDENMQMSPNDRFSQSDDDQQMVDPPENDMDQAEDSNNQRSVNIANESNIPDTEMPNNIVYQDDDEDRFLSDDQTAPQDDNENDNNYNNDKIKELSEKEEGQPGNLEDTTANIAMSLLPQINEDEDENENNKENSKDEINDEKENEKDNSNDNNNNSTDQEAMSINKPNDIEGINNNENINANDNLNINEDLNNNNGNTDKNDNENINATGNLNDNEVLGNDENKNDNENTINNENTNDNENAINNENTNDNENTINNENMNENANEDHPSEEGMEVKDSLTPQRFTRQRRPFSSTESLSKLPPLSTDPDLDAENLRLLNNFKKKGRIPDTTQRAQLFQYIQREKINSVVAQKFGKAQEFQNILQKYQKAIIEQEVKDRNYEKMESLKSNLETIEEDLKQTEKDTKNKIGDEKEKQKEHYYNIIQKQDEELNIFERKWNDPNFIQKYAKPSSVLLAMKTRERSMVITKMFDQAEYVHNKVKELEKIESQQAQELAENEMKKEKQKILAKQDSEIEAYKLHCSQQIELIRRNHEIEKKKKQDKIQKIKDEIQELKKNPPTSLPPMAGPCQEMMTQTVMTPRTLQRYTMYKSQSKKPVLTLNPLKNVRPTKRSRTKFYSSLT